MIAFAHRFLPGHLLRLGCLALATCALLAIATEVKGDDFALTPEQEARIKQYLPRTYAKLSKRNPVHTVAIGDSVMVMYGYGDEYNNSLSAYQTLFLNELADQFYYPGGVRIIKPGKGKPEKLHPLMGVEITQQNLSRGGKLMFHALQMLRSVAFENKPDLVMISYGINDATNNESVEKYRADLEEAVALVKANGADLMLFSPTLTVEDPPEELLARTRPYANAMREVAEANHIWFSDLGDLSWFVRVDDRTAHLKDAKKAYEARKKLEEESDAPPRVSPVQSPLMEQLDPDPEKKAARLFNQVVDDYRKFFNHGDVIDWVHPNADFHRQLGKRIFKELLNGPKTLAWKVSNPVVTLQPDRQLLLTYELENTSNEEQEYSILPLIARHWKPLNAPTGIKVKPGAKELVKITWGMKGDPNLLVANMPISEGAICFSIMHASRTQVHIDDLNADIAPVVVAWESGSQFNLEQQVELKAKLVNRSQGAVKGTWEASLMDQKWSGEYAIGAGETEDITLPVTLPNNGPTRLKKGLNLVVKTDSVSFQFPRVVELSRNFGLKQEVALMQVGDAGSKQEITDELPDAGKPGVKFRADADNNALYLTWDVVGINLQDAPNGQPAYVVDFNIDARSYGKRLTNGSTDSVRASGAAADGAGRVGQIPPWSFGSDYAMYFDPAFVHAKLTSRPDGSRRITMVLPRSYLYLHEWKLNNGNSQLGFNTYISLWQNGDETSGGGQYVTYCFNHSVLHRDDAFSLNVLELHDKPTARWTLRLY